jgi:hypothetical protein
MPIILRFGLLMESVSSCIFFSQLLFFCFAINFYFIFKLWDSAFHMF